MARLSPPPGARVLRSGGARAWVVDDARPWVEDALRRHGTLYEAARRERDVLELRGRGPVYAFATGDGRWVVRRCRRGGAVAPVLGDRFLRLGTPRPLREMAASERARQRGLPTPRVLAAAVHPAGAFYRGDVMSEYVTGTRDLAALLFGAAAPGADGADAEDDDAAREEALRAAGRLVARMGRAGVEHPDLNAKNVLVGRSGGRAEPWLVDLDRVRVRAPGEALHPARMLARLERSLRKFEAAGGRALAEAEWAALREPSLAADVTG